MEDDTRVYLDIKELMKKVREAQYQQPSWEEFEKFMEDYINGNLPPLELKPKHKWVHSWIMNEEDLKRKETIPWRIKVE